jgi:integrase
VADDVDGERSRWRTFGERTIYDNRAAAVSKLGAPGLHFHDLRHTGNMLAAPGASLADLKARMGHDSARAAMIYQHATQEADQAIADALDKRIERSREIDDDGPDDDDDGIAGVLARTG